MFGIAAVVAFAVALILNIVGGKHALVVDFTLGGLACLAVHLLWPLTPWHRAP